MSRSAVAGIGIGVGALLLRERRARMRAERLGAATLETLLDAIEANDAETGAHVRRVARYALILAEAADLSDRAQASIERVALFHDIGKLDQALSDIFQDHSRLSPSERRAIRSHPERGAQVLAPITVFYPDLGKGVAAHHERWNGSGYPRGLKGARIPLSARVVAIADTFDAMTHDRGYRRAKSIAAALRVITAGRGTLFDPELVDVFLAPPVLQQIREALREPYPRRKREVTRRRGRSQPASDIKFRWRTRSGGPRARDR